MNRFTENLGGKALFFCVALLGVYFFFGSEWRDPSVYLVVIGLFIAVFFGDILSKFNGPKE